MSDYFGLPPRAEAFLSDHPHARANLDTGSGYCWLTSSRSVAFWRFAEAHSARVVVLCVPTLDDDPGGCTSAHDFPLTCVLGNSLALGPATVVACTRSGVLHVWFQVFPYSPHADPVTQRVLGLWTSGYVDPKPAVRAMAARPLPSSGDPGFVCAVAGQDRSIIVVKGTGGDLDALQVLPPSEGGDGGWLRGMASLLGGASWRASRSPVLQLAIIPTAALKWRLLVLTEEALDSWLVPVDTNESADLTWSFNLLPALKSQLKERSELAMIGMAVTPDLQNLVVGSTNHNGFCLHTLQIGQSGNPTLLDFTPIEGIQWDHHSCARAASQRLSCGDIGASGQLDCLIVSDQCVWGFSGTYGRPILFVEDQTNLVAALSYDGQRYSVMNDTHVQCGFVADLYADEKIAWHNSTLINKCLESLYHRTIAGHGASPELGGLHKLLEGWGAFEQKGNVNAIVKFMKRTADLQLKMWAPGVSSIALDHLAEKRQAYQLLLEQLLRGGCVRKLDADSLSIILDRLAKLVMIHALADHASRLKDQGAVLRATMTEAGHRSRMEAPGSDNGNGNYSDFEICLSRSSVSATNFLKAATTRLRTDVIYGGVEPWERVVVIKELWSAIGKAFGDARDVCQQFLTEQVKAVVWLHDVDARNVIKELAEGSLRTFDAQLHVPGADQLVEILHDCTVNVLHMFITAMDEVPGETLLNGPKEYQELRTRYLRALLRIGRLGRNVTSADLLSDVEKLASQHRSYELLFDIVDHEPSHTKRDHYMHELDRNSSGGSFMLYTFQQLLMGDRHAELLSLPEDFDEDLHAFLEPWPNLHWIVAARIRRFDTAANALEKMPHSGWQQSLSVLARRAAVHVE